MNENTLKTAIPPVFAQVILGAPKKWITYCQTCNKEFGEPALEATDLYPLILEHSTLHNPE